MVTDNCKIVWSVKDVEARQVNKLRLLKGDIWASGIYSDFISSGDFLPTSYLFELEFESM